MCFICLPIQPGAKFFAALAQDGMINEEAISVSELERLYSPLREQVSDSIHRQETVLSQIQVSSVSNGNILPPMLFFVLSENNINFLGFIFSNCSLLVDGFFFGVLFFTYSLISGCCFILSNFFVIVFLFLALLYSTLHI